ANPALTFPVSAVGGTITTDSVNDTIPTLANATTRVANVPITQGTLGNANYTVSFVDGQLTITPRPISFTASATSRFGNAAITRGTLGEGANSEVSFINGALTITQVPTIVTANDFLIADSNANPTLAFEVAGAAAPGAALSASGAALAGVEGS
ncbi:MAG: MBG domain-containing protein, partial [Erythrobacter sp.]